jgi:hypothetical protein
LKVFEQYFHKEAAVQGPIHSDSWPWST